MKYTTVPKLFTALNDELNEGKLLLPSFQRNYDWNENDGLALLDSIYKGFPIGSFYTWLTSVENKVHSQNFNGFEAKNNSQEGAVAYLIDGQQRLTTLLRLYNKERDFDLFFDPTVAQFKPRKKNRNLYFWSKSCQK